MPESTGYPALFSPFYIGPLDISNRIIAAAMVTNLADAGGGVADRVIDHYTALAAGGAGLVTVEMTAIHPFGRAWFYMLGLWDDHFVPGFQDLTTAIHAEGTKCSLQLGHAGRQTTRAIIGTRPVGPSELSQFPAGHPNHMLPRALSATEIEAVIGQTCAAAERARKAGFDAVEIHAAHGYLFHQFLSPAGNRREDDFGGNTTRRCRIVTRIIEGIKRVCGLDFGIICKIDGDEHVSGGIGVNEAGRIARHLEDAGADAILVSAGCGASLQFLLPPAYMPSLPNLEEARKIKGNVSIPVGVVGKVDDFAMADNVLSRRDVDFVALARPFLADPELPRKLQCGTELEIRRCLYCNEKCNGIDQQYQIGCSINPCTGREHLVAKRSFAPAGKAGRIVVVGGGPAGLEAALAAAQRGCQVHLFERNPRLGGQVNLVRRIPGKAPWSRIVPYFETLLNQNDVVIHLHHEVTLDEIMELAPRAIILATGAAPGAGDVEVAGGAGAVTAFDALAEPDTIGRAVAIVGGQRLAVDTALFLASQGKRVTILCRGPGEDYLLAGVTPSLRPHVLAALSREKVTVNYRASCCSINHDCLSVQLGEETCEMVFETVVLATALQPVLPAFVTQARSQNLQVYRVGDCLAPRGIGTAVLEGREAACQA